MLIVSSSCEHLSSSYSQTYEEWRYHIVSDMSYTRLQAEKYCEQRSMALVSLETIQEFEFLNNILTQLTGKWCHDNLLL